MRLRALLVTVSFVLAGILGMAAPASASAPVLLSGSAWLNGDGVNVCSSSTDTSCGDQTHVGGISSNWWQCVELAQRLYQARGWHSGIFAGVNGASDIYDQTAANGMTSQANGSINSIVPGDMIIHSTAGAVDGWAGHVSIVDHVDGSTVYAVEQNTWNNQPRASYSLSGGTLSRSGMGAIRGVVHDPNNQSSSAPVITDTDGDGVPDGSDACPTQAGPSSLNGCPDSDSDGVVNVNDTCPKFAGTSQNRGCRLDGHTVSGNFAGGDSYTDTLTFYDYGSNNLGAFVSQGSANGVGQPQLLWTTGANQWSWGASSFYAGNFAGNDAYTDVIGLYDYGNGQLGAFLFQGNGNGVGQRQYLWTTSTNSWSHGNARYVVGNFSGNDGKDDILAFYGYENSNTGVSVFAGNGSGINQPSSQWTTGPDVWNAKNAEYVAGNFAGNDAYTDVIAFYQYTGNNMGAFLFQGGSGGLGQPQHLWSTGQQTWNIKNAEFFAGDFAGNDGVTDVMALYNLGNSTLGGYVMEGNGSGVNQIQNLWTTSANQWNLANTKAVAGQFSGSHTSLFGWYNYGSTTGGALFATASPISGVLQPQIKWTTTTGQWSWPAM
jgi:hypothetical protein